jgi:hypothetical protein
MLLVIALVNGCATVTPDPLKDNMPSYDSTTPPQYDANNSGFLNYLKNDKGETIGACITKGARERYNNLINAFGLQLYESERVQLNHDSGISYFVDIHGNEIFKITPQHLAFFMKMNRWRKEGKEEDSLWLKTKELFK